MPLSDLVAMVKAGRYGKNKSTKRRTKKQTKRVTFTGCVKRAAAGKGGASKTPKRAALRRR